MPPGTPLDPRGPLDGTSPAAGEPPLALVIDNYDSFTYNLVQYLLELGARVEVRRNDQVSVAQVLALAPSHVVISPGPCTPTEAGVSLELVPALSGRIPLLGVCLGHQCIGQALGARVVHSPRVMHGKTSWVHHDGRGVFLGLPSPFEATRYHSLVVSPDGLPDALEVSAWTDTEGTPTVMGLRHRRHALEGVQFHPESILTEHGHALLANFLGVVDAATLRRAPATGAAVCRARQGPGEAI